MGSTGTISPQTDGNINITAFKSWVLLSVKTSSAAWVRIYASSAARTADVSRGEGADPVAGSGIIAEVITTAGVDQTQNITPFIFGGNLEISSNIIYLAVRNKSLINKDITVTLTLLQLEV